MVLPITNKNKRRNIIERFANKVELIYFGAVDQHSDNHEIVRGFTVSASHKDFNYCVGSASGYDIRLVDRIDILNVSKDKNLNTQNWLIIAIKLHNRRDMPHFLINAKNHSQLAFSPFFVTFTSMSQIEMGAFENYPSSFTDKFAVYSNQSASLIIQQIISAAVAQAIGDHFWPFSIECSDGILYTYLSGVTLSGEILSTMYQNSLWLAGQIDNRTQNS